MTLSDGRECNSTASFFRKHVNGLHELAVTIRASKADRDIHSTRTSVLVERHRGTCAVKSVIALLGLRGVFTSTFAECVNSGTYKIREELGGLPLFPSQACLKPRLVEYEESAMAATTANEHLADVLQVPKHSVVDKSYRNVHATL